VLHSKLLNNQMARWYQRLDMAWDSETPRKTGIQDGTQKMGICSKKTWTMHDCIHCIQQTIEGMNRKKNRTLKFGRLSILNQQVGGFTNKVPTFLSKMALT
jgi:hypothetical protein